MGSIMVSNLWDPNTNQPTTPTQPFILMGSINRVAMCPAGPGEGGAVTSVGWQMKLYMTPLTSGVA